MKGDRAPWCQGQPVFPGIRGLVEGLCGLKDVRCKTLPGSVVVLSGAFQRMLALWTSGQPCLCNKGSELCLGLLTTIDSSRRTVKTDSVIFK